MISLLARISFPSLFNQHWINSAKALSKSPNLLDKPFDFFDTHNIHQSSIIIILSFVVIITIMLFSRFSVDIYNDSDTFRYPLNTLVFILIFTSLAYVTRSFHRSDFGHVIYGLIYVPLAYLLITRTRSRTDKSSFLTSYTAFLGLLMAVLLPIKVVNHKGNWLNFLASRNDYDPRVLPASDFKSYKFDGFTFNKPSYDTYRKLYDELGIRCIKQLPAVTSAGVFDMTNQPFIFYGSIDNKVLFTDIHTLFFSEGKDENDIIDFLDSYPNLPVVWSSGHWSENLDDVPIEFRLPQVADYIFKNYTVGTWFGKTLLLSRTQNAPSCTSDTKACCPVKPYIPNSDLRSTYSLGFSTVKLKEIGNSFHINLHSLSSQIVDIKNKPSGLAVKTSFSETSKVNIRLKDTSGTHVLDIQFLAANGTHLHSIPLYNIPILKFFPDHLVLEITTHKP